MRQYLRRTRANDTSFSDFPSLSGGPRPQQSNNANTGWNSNAIRQPSAPAPPQTQSIQQRTPSAAPSQQSLDQFDGQRLQQPAAERSGGDDFPPLGGQVNGDVFTSANGLTSSVGSPDGQPRMNGQQTQMPIREGSGSFQPIQQRASTQSQRQPSQTELAPPLASRVNKYSVMTESEKWGIPGLMAAFEARRQADNGGQGDETLPPLLKSSVIMGHDLESLGLDLGSADSLYPTFTPFQAIGSSGSTFDYHERNMIPDFTLPSAYTVTNVPPLNTRMSAFSDGKPNPTLFLKSSNHMLTHLPETLFCIFFLEPRSLTAELAAAELNSRDWRWHKLLRQWLQKDGPARDTSSLPLIDLTNGAPIGQQPIRTSERGEKGVYVFFDAMNWRRERRWLELDYEHLDVGRVGLPVAGLGRVQTGGVGEVGGNVGGQASGVGSSGIPSA